MLTRWALITLYFSHFLVLWFSESRSRSTITSSISKNERCHFPHLDSFSSLYSLFAVSPNRCSESPSGRSPQYWASNPPLGYNFELQLWYLWLPRWKKKSAPTGFARNPGAANIRPRWSICMPTWLYMCLRYDPCCLRLLPYALNIPPCNLLCSTMPA